MAYYKHHIFFCLNEREDGAQCCTDYNAHAMFDYMKKKIKSLNLNGPNKVRVNRGGCFDRCHEGPLMVIYPEAVWYRYIDKEDLDEIINQHLEKGKVVERLLA
jgi:(2Fe-2S) ferredoxin